MQNDFTTGPLGNAECAAVIPKVAEVIKTGVYDRIIFTQDTHQSNYLDTQEGKRLPVVHCIEGTEGWEIAPVIRKNIWIPTRNCMRDAMTSLSA